MLTILPSCRLDFARHKAENGLMGIPGRVRNGVVVLDQGQTLPEGARVMVARATSRIGRKTTKKKRVKFPLIRSKRPGTLDLSSERIAEILQEEDLASLPESLRP